jgi:hypothetical protein
MADGFLNHWSTSSRNCDPARPSDWLIDEERGFVALPAGSYSTTSSMGAPAAKVVKIGQFFLKASASCSFSASVGPDERTTARYC